MVHISQCATLLRQQHEMVESRYQPVITIAAYCHVFGVSQGHANTFGATPGIIPSGNLRDKLHVVVNLFGP